MEETYTLDEDTYQRLAWADVDPLSVTDILYAGWVMRRHIGSSLQIAGQDRHGDWYAVALVEITDDQYLVTGARRLDPDEVTTLAQIRKNGDQS